MQVKKVYPYIFILIIFYIIIGFFFKETTLYNKTLPQQDVIQFEGMSKWAREYYKENGNSPSWNVGMFSGMPNYAIAFGVHNWPLNSVNHFMTGIFFNHSIPSVILLNILCFWVLMLSFNVRPTIAAIAALVYGFNTYLIVTIEAGHFTKCWAIAYAALTLAGLRCIFKGKYILGGALFLFGLGLELGADHIQITFYLVFVCAIYALSELYYKIKERSSKSILKIILIIAGVCLIASGTVLAKLWMLNEYSAYSIRGKRLLSGASEEKSSKPKQGLSKDYAFSWSQGKMESFTLLVPYFNGGGSYEKLKKGSNLHQLFEELVGKQRTRKLIKDGRINIPMYFGDQPFTAGPVYAGAITCFLFILGLVLVEPRQRNWILAASILTMFFAWGKNFAFLNYFLFEYFPLFNKFRSVSMALSMTLILMPLLGFIAIDRIIDTKITEKLQKQMLIGVGVLVSITVLISIYSFVGDFSMEKDFAYGQQIFGKNNNAVTRFVTAIEADRASALRIDAFKATALILIVFGLIWMYLKQKLAKKWVIIGIGILAFGDMWVVAKRYLYDTKFEKQAVKKAIAKTPADDFILNDKDPHFRVFNLRGAFQEARTSNFHKSIGGYHAAKLRRYQDLIENHLANENNELIGLLQSGSMDFSSLNALNMLNAKYFKFGDSEREVILNNDALGNAWFVNNLVDVKTAGEEIEKVGEITPSTTAVVNFEEFKLEKNSFEKDSTASIRLIEESPHKLVYKSKNNHEGFAIFSEIYYPEGWEAFVDGNLVPIVRANYLLRALKVPSGEHTLELRHKSKPFIITAKVSKFCGYAYGLLVLIGFGFVIYRQIKSDDLEVSIVNMPEDNKEKSVENAKEHIIQSKQQHSKPSKKKPKQKKRN